MSEPELTFWNGRPAPARRVRVIVDDKGSFPTPWFKHLVGQEHDAVEVISEGRPPFYIDNTLDRGWRKVTEYQGSAQFGHSSLDVKRVVE